MKIVEADNYEQLCAQFQFQWIDTLRRTLEKYGVPTAAAKEICGEFTFDLSMMFDQGEIQSGGRSYRPVIGFTDDEDEPTLTLQDGTVEFHEYAFGTTDEAFELAEAALKNTGAR